jgi:hypothetical protein
MDSYHVCVQDVLSSADTPALEGEGYLPPDRILFCQCNSSYLYNGRFAFVLFV